MKNRRIWLQVAVAAAALTQARTGHTQGIQGSAHDMSGYSWSGGQICVVCHTPHNAIPAAAPLWNHQVTTASFITYSSPVLGASLVIGQPSGTSKLCLSCHDGTVAIENFGGVTNGAYFMTGPANLGTDMSNDHPISFAYDSALATNPRVPLFDPSTRLWDLGSPAAGTIAQNVLFTAGPQSPTLTQLECASCHAVHGSPFPPLLRKTNAGSALCLTCHNM